MMQQQHIQANIMDLKNTGIVNSSARSRTKGVLVCVDVVCFILLFLIYLPLFFIRVGAVSYTHLDVYKRQLL